jgi:NAD(P)H dehydrogenase (quinone)
LRDNLYADFLPAMIGPDGVLRGPAGQGRVAAVAQNDIADAAAAVLSAAAEHAGAT